VSRRDDLITLGYVILQLYLGKLPWQGFKVPKISSKRYTALGNEKASYSNKVLCQSCPPQFEVYMDYVYSMNFVDAADFNFLRGLVDQAAVDAKVNIFDNVFDWTELLWSEPYWADKRNLFEDFFDIKYVICKAYNRPLPKPRFSVKKIGIPRSRPEVDIKGKDRRSCTSYNVLRRNSFRIDFNSLFCSFCRNSVAEKAPRL